MTHHAVDGEALLTPAEVAALFRVDPKTVTRWARAGKLASLRTLGGHRRYRESEVRGLLGGADIVDEVEVVDQTNIVDKAEVAS
jgi:excisionase family DNA binding protein